MLVTPDGVPIAVQGEGRRRAARGASSAPASTAQSPTTPARRARRRLDQRGRAPVAPLSLGRASARRAARRARDADRDAGAGLRCSLVVIEPGGSPRSCACRWRAPWRACSAILRGLHRPQPAEAHDARLPRGRWPQEQLLELAQPEDPTAISARFAQVRGSVQVRQGSQNPEDSGNEPHGPDQLRAEAGQRQDRLLRSRACRARRPTWRSCTSARPQPNRGELTSISTDGDRTLFFDFMPLDLGTVAGMRTCFQLYTVPGQVYYNSTRKLVLQGVDGVVFVADSSAAMVEENLESLRNLEENLNEYGKSLATLPLVIQYNKRDLPDALPVEELNAQLNPHGAPCFEAIANTGQGVFPTLKALAAACSRRSTRAGASTRPQLPPQAPARRAMPHAAAAHAVSRSAAHAGHHAHRGSAAAPGYGQPQQGYGRQPVYHAGSGLRWRRPPPLQLGAPDVAPRPAARTRRPGAGNRRRGGPGLQLAAPARRHAAPALGGGGPARSSRRRPRAPGARQGRRAKAPARAPRRSSSSTALPPARRAPRAAPDAGRQARRRQDLHLDLHRPGDRRRRRAHQGRHLLLLRVPPWSRDQKLRRSRLVFYEQDVERLEGELDAFLEMSNAQVRAPDRQGGTPRHAPRRAAQHLDRHRSRR